MFKGRCLLLEFDKSKKKLITVSKIRLINQILQADSMAGLL